MLIREFAIGGPAHATVLRMHCPPFLTPRLLIHQHCSEVTSTGQSFLACAEGTVTPSSEPFCDLWETPIAYITSQGGDVFTCLSYCST